MGTTEQRTSEIACKEFSLPITPQEFHVQMKDIGNKMLRGAPLMRGEILSNLKRYIELNIYQFQVQNVLSSILVKIMCR